MSKTKWYARPIYLLVALALVLSLGIVAVPMAGTVEASPDDRYVDGAQGADDGTHGMGPGSDAFKTITYAVSQADSGDTINVAEGAYDTALGEGFPITVNLANLTIQATGTAANTIIDAGGAVNAITVSADGVTIDGFKVIGSGTGAPGNGAIQVNSNGNTISNNEICDNN